MPFVIYISSAFIIGLMLLISAMYSSVQKEVVALSDKLTEKLDTASYVLLGVIALICIISAIKNRQFFYVVVMFLSFSKVVLFLYFGFTVLIAAIEAADNIIVGFFMIPLSLILGLIPAFLDMKFTASAWEDADASDYSAPLVQFFAVLGIIGVLYVISLFA